jgi:Domain of unknown function (DUF1707)
MTAQRIGDRDRRATGEHIAEAYAEGYISEDEMHERTSQLAGSWYATDLLALTGDLPSMGQLTGKTVDVKVPRVPLVKRVKGSLEEHYGTAATLGVIVSLLAGILPAVYIANIPHGHFGALGDVVIAATIILGISGVMGAAFWANYVYEKKHENH